MSNRERNFDLLRLISCIAVIFIHASSSYKSNLILDDVFIGTKGIETFVILAYNVLPRFSVAIFFMISGAFILSNPKNKDIKYFYKKIFTNIFLPAIIFYVFYFLLVEIDGLVQVLRNGYPLVTLYSYLIDLLAGAPSSHLWTMTILFVIYLLVPLIMIIKDRLPSYKFNRIVFIYFIVALISQHSSYYTFYWSIGIVLDYLAYFLLGYVIKSNIKDKNKNYCLPMILVATILSVITLIIQYNHTLSGIQEYAESFQLIDPFSPLICLSSILVFIAFSNLDIKINVYPISKHCFVTYLAHAGIIQMLLVLNKKITILPSNPLVSIPFIVLITFVLSIVTSILFNLVIKTLRNKYHFSDKLFSIVVPLIDKVEQFNKDIFNI